MNATPSQERQSIFRSRDFPFEENIRRGLIAVASRQISGDQGTVGGYYLACGRVDDGEAIIVIGYKLASNEKMIKYGFGRLIFQPEKEGTPSARGLPSVRYQAQNPLGIEHPRQGMEVDSTPWYNTSFHTHARKNDVGNTTEGFFQG